MKTQVAKLIVLAISLAGVGAAEAHEPCFAGGTWSGRVVYRSVQKTPQYRLRRAEVVTGARLTLFANFLQEKAGYVMFDVNGTTTNCKVIDWKNESVTTQLPLLGLNHPMDAQIRIVLPNGRVAKSFQILLISQPDIVHHKETIPQPQPPTAAAMSPAYAQPVNGGTTLVR